MKHFLLHTLVGALAAFAIVVATNVVGEALISPWKYGDGSPIAGGVGLALVYIGVVISMPVRWLTFGSDSSLVSIVAMMVVYGLWGAVLAALFERLTRRSSRRASRAAELKR
jgi:hypothetical protein